MQWMINLKSRGEIERMKGASRIVAEILLEHRRQSLTKSSESRDVDRVKPSAARWRDVE